MRPGMELIVAGTLLGAALIILLLAVLAMLLTRKNLTEYSRKLSYTLDRMISGDKEIAFEEEKETLIGRIQVKMRQVYEIMQAQADQRWEEKKQMEEIVSDISHQVKTPIANLRMYHELAAQEPEKAGEFMEAEERQIDKLEFLMKTMIKMSRLETGLIEVKPLKNKVYDLIFQAVCTIALKAEKKEIDIEVECSENLEALFDRKWTVEALANILDNAVKYSGKGSRIRIRADRTDYFVRIRVEDEGRGIREDNLPNIFKRFYREKESNDVEGVGIGLYLTRQIVMQEKGFVEALSRQGIGSVFSLHLPADVPETFEG
ncbi:sensor histidine kinase [Claveliimonas bilis]|uniref:sensor histidine kinase n=1 Tax=Claveliimonas bilis TaxID=3028070 RepID=UPI00292ED817|nr:HAMP domain-containing sensor histidine kinase [Claveliimonas bilis]BDZ80019.1 two-component sensor histidine kinase [Claveliimonas bilis]